MGWPQCGATQIYLATQPMGLFPFQDSISLIQREDGEKQCPCPLCPLLSRLTTDICFSPLYSLMISFFYLPAGSYSW